MKKKFPDDQWIECPSGELIDARHRLARSRQRRQLLRYGSALALMLGVGLGSMTLLQTRSSRRNTTVQVACRDVHAWGKDYVAGRLDPEKAALVQEHLSHCASCKRMIGKLAQR